MSVHPLPGLPRMRILHPELIDWAAEHASDALRALQEFEREQSCYWTHDDRAGWVLIPGCYAVIGGYECTCACGLEGAADALFRRRAAIEQQIAAGERHWYFEDPRAHVVAITALRAEVRRALRYARALARTPEGIDVG